MLAPAATAIRSFIAAGYTGLTIRWPNEAIPPERDAGQAYIEAEIIGGRNAIRGFSRPGNRLFVHPGLVRFYIHAPWPDGMDGALATADTLAALLERIDIEAPARPQIVRTQDFSVYDDVASAEEGNFAVLMCSVPFDFYYHR
ncbi:MAG: hypothetical protein WDN25_03985 [Acetobacteraceae bacterium]